jgi:hypothetical protein
VGVLCKCRAEVASEKSATKAANTQALSGTRVLNGMPKVDLVMVEPSCVPIARVGGSPPIPTLAQNSNPAPIPDQPPALINFRQYSRLLAHRADGLLAAKCCPSAVYLALRNETRS